MDYNNQNFEKEKKDQMRKQVLDEINNKGNVGLDSNIQSFGPPKKKSSVSFSDELENNQIQNNYTNSSNDYEIQGEKGSVIPLIFGVILVSVAVLFFPKVSKYFEEKRNAAKKPVVTEKKEEEKVYEKIKLDDEVVENAKYPIMHIDTSSKKTYYSLDKVTSSSFSNSDLLYNALSRIDDKNMSNYKGGYSSTFCGGNNKISIDSRFFKLRLEHMFTKKVTYKNSDFSVPVNNSGTKYYGTWKYDSKLDKYIYYGDCNANKNNILYYDINVPYEVDNSDKNIEMYINNYVVFAIVNTANKTYTLYSDYNYTNKIDSGKLTTNSYSEELKNKVKNINKEELKKYKYTFSIVDCPYQDYCFVSGEWIK